MKLRYRNNHRYTFPFYISGGLRLLDSYNNTTRVMRKSIVFKSIQQCNRDKCNNILFGFTVGDLKLYYRWSYSEVIKRFEVYAVSENKSINFKNEVKMGTYDSAGCYVLEISINTKTGQSVFISKDLFNNYNKQITCMSNTLNMKSVYISRGISPKQIGDTVADISIRNV